MLLPRSKLEYDAILSAMDNLLVLKAELARLANASSMRNPSSAVIDPDQGDFQGNTDGLHMTDFSRFNSNINADRNGETRGSITDDAGDLSVSGGEFDRQTHTQYRIIIVSKLKVN